MRYTAMCDMCLEDVPDDDAHCLKSVNGVRAPVTAATGSTTGNRFSRSGEPARIAHRRWGTDSPNAASHRTPTTPRYSAKIGRASCRERVDFAVRGAGVTRAVWTQRRVHGIYTGMR